VRIEFPSAGAVDKVDFLGNRRAGLVVALAIPLLLLFAFCGMLRCGIAASLLSLGALDFRLADGITGGFFSPARRPSQGGLPSLARQTCRGLVR
jgi:AcrB/AcrD/AcrF family